jgi:hypothetical protein
MQVAVFLIHTSRAYHVVRVFSLLEQIDSNMRIPAMSATSSGHVGHS